VTPRHLQVIYCDDIREEVGNKLSLMGVYDKNLHPSVFPCEIPKLCLKIVVVTPEHQPLGRAIVRVLLDDQVLVETPDLTTDPAYCQFLAASLSSGSVQATDPAQSRVAALSVMVVIAPLKVAAPGVLRVRVETEDGELRAGALNITPQPTAVSPITTASL